MTTEPEAKAIEPDYQLLKSNLADAAVRLSKTRSNADLSLFLDAMNEVVAALPSVDAHREVKSRLQAAEAELGRVSAIVEAWGDIARTLAKSQDRLYAHKGTISPFFELGYSKDGPAVLGDSAGEVALKLAKLKPNSVAAPPSPPVAPEPAQENQDLAVDFIVNGPDRVTPESIAAMVDGKLGKVSPEIAALVEQIRGIGSSGEAAGDGVTHAEARACLSKIPERREHDTLWRYIDQQLELRGQAEREAAEMVEEIAKEYAATIAADRDAERVQKEALRVELERVTRHIELTAALRAERDELKDVLEQLRVYFQIMAQNEVTALGESAEGKAYRHAAEMVAAYRDEPNKQPAPAAPLMTPEEEREAQAFSDAMNVKCGTFRLVERQRWDDCPTCHAFGGELCRDQHGNATRRPHQIEPAPAAPVAKEEATAEAQSEPGHWGPVGVDVARCNWVSSSGHRCVSDNAHTGPHYTRAEPAPQPPATTGEPLLGPVDALRAEIVAALRKVTRTLITLDPATLARAVADELERRKP